MALTYGFYDATIQNGEPDREYNAEQMSALFDGLILDGVYSGVGNCFAVTPNNGMNVSIDTGRAWFNHTWTLNDAIAVRTVPPADVANTRIDAIVLQVDKRQAQRANSITIVSGTPSANPVKPTLTRSEEVNQYALAYITIPPQESTITAAMIENVVGTDETPFVSGIIQQVSIETLLQNWETQWDDYLVNLQTQAESDIADFEQRTKDAVDNWFAGIQASVVPSEQTYTNLYNLIYSTVVDDTLYAANWVNNTYTISNINVTATSNQEVTIGLNLTDVQKDAWNDAVIEDGGQTTGSFTLIARGDVPTVDIPIRVIFRGIK